MHYITSAMVDQSEEQEFHLFVLCWAQLILHLDFSLLSTADPSAVKVTLSVGSQTVGVPALAFYIGLKRFYFPDPVFERFCAVEVADGHALSSEQQNDGAPFKLESTVPSRLALGARCGYSQRCWGSPVRQKKKHTGNGRLQP